MASIWDDQYMGLQEVHREIENLAKKGVLPSRQEMSPLRSNLLQFMEYIRYCRHDEIGDEVRLILFQEHIRFQTASRQAVWQSFMLASRVLPELENILAEPTMAALKRYGIYLEAVVAIYDYFSKGGEFCDDENTY